MRKSTKVRVNTSTHCQLFSLLLLVISVTAWKKTDKKGFDENIIGMKLLPGLKTQDVSVFHSQCLQLFTISCHGEAQSIFWCAFPKPGMMQSVVLNHMNHEPEQSCPAALTLSCCAVMTGHTPSALTFHAAVMESRLVFTEVSNEHVFFGDVSIFHAHHP